MTPLSDSVMKPIFELEVVLECVVVSFEYVETP